MLDVKEPGEEGPPRWLRVPGRYQPPQEAQGGEMLCDHSVNASVNASVSASIAACDATRTSVCCVCAAAVSSTGAPTLGATGAVTNTTTTTTSSQEAMDEIVLLARVGPQVEELEEAQEHGLLLREPMLCTEEHVVAQA